MKLKQQERSALSHIPQWRASKMTHIAKAYGTYSRAKGGAWSFCEGLCDDFGGRGLKVISRNVNMFTAGFEFTDPDTGVIKFMYISPNYTVIVDMEVAA